MSLEPIKKDLFNKAANFTKASDDMGQIKQIIVDKTRISINVISIKYQAIKIRAENSAAANDLFMQKEELLDLINNKTQKNYKKITIFT